MNAMRYATPIESGSSEILVSGEITDDKILKIWDKATKSIAALMLNPGPYRSAVKIVNKWATK